MSATTTYAIPGLQPRDERALPANAPLALDDPSTAWLVTAGRVALFAVRTDRDAPSRRVTLFGCAAGELILPPPAGAPLGLLAVGIEDGTAVTPVALDELAAGAADGGSPAGSSDDTGIGTGTGTGADTDTDTDTDAVTASAAIAPLVERWLGELTGCLAATGPEDGVALTAGEAASLDAGAAAWPAHHAVWVEGAGLRLFGQTDPDGDALLPLPPQAWATADRALELVPGTGAAALVDPRAWRGVARFTTAALARLAVRLGDDEHAVGERIAARIAHERGQRERTYTALGAILGEPEDRALTGDDGDALLIALRQVGAAQDIEIVAPPHGSAGAHVDPLDAIVRASGVRARTVVLEGTWWREDTGPLLARREADGRPLALLPRRRGGHEALDPETGIRTPVDAELDATLAREATMLYRALPPQPLGDRDVLRFLLRPIAGDLRRVALLAVLVAGLSLLTPIITKHIFSTVVPGLQHSNLAWFTTLLVVFALASFGFSLMQQLAVLRIQGRVTTDVQAAMWDRVLDLPLPFFRKHSAGGLTMRVMGIEQIRLSLTTVVVTATLAIPVGVANLVLAYVLDLRLALFGTVALVVFGAGMFALMRYQVPRQRRVQTATQELFGTAMQLVEAVGKLRVANAEARGFVQWGRRFGTLKQAFYDAQLGFAMSTAFVAAAPALGTLALFVGASTLETGALTGATFLAFNTAFAQALVALTGLTSVATFLAQSIPLYENTRPILAEPRETDIVRSDPGELRGTIELSHVSLRYAPDAPLVLDDISFRAEPGEFIAIVGPSGAGKSSVMRVLLGFEIPEVGSVRFDGKDLESLDPRALRRQMGVVVQSARLMPGDIYTNIVGARPLTPEDAWEAAETAGIADDIRAMPMEMHTFVSEGAGTFSGGQRQRLLIARAVVGRPRILLFDEATSALDNRTQAEVSGAIEQLRATRIVIAHRLSTVRRADRIIVIDGGQIVQQGAFDELIDVEGPFRTLARRQLA